MAWLTQHMHCDTECANALGVQTQEWVEEQNVHYLVRSFCLLPADQPC